MAKEKFEDSKVDRRSERADGGKDRSKGKKKGGETRPMAFKPNYKSILNDKGYFNKYVKELRFKKDFHIASMTTERIVMQAKVLARWNKKNENIVGLTDESTIMKQKANNTLRLQYMMNELELREVPIMILKGLNSYIFNPEEQERFFDKKKIDWIFSKHIEEVRYYVA